DLGWASLEGPARERGARMARWARIADAAPLAGGSRRRRETSGTIRRGLARTWGPRRGHPRGDNAGAGPGQGPGPGWWDWRQRRVAKRGLEGRDRKGPARVQGL